MLSFLNKPYPHNDNFKRNFLVSFCIGAFVALFLIVFQPFNISLWQDPDKILKLAGFGIISFAVPVLCNLITHSLPVKEREDNWKVWKEILNVIFAILLIAVGNLVYATYVGIGTLTLKNYFTFIFITFSVGIFPIGFSVAAKYNKFLKLNQKTAAEVNVVLDEKPQAALVEKKENQKLILIAENEKDKLEIDWQQLLYMESADNYSIIYYLERNADSKSLVRGSLKRMEQQCAAFPSIIRCHRGFIVNLQNVTHIEGNAAGYKLSLKNSKNLVPVSRNYGASVTEKLKRNN